MSSGLYTIPQTVVEDTAAFRGEVEKFISGSLSAVAFRAIRVPMGIYEQRENGTYMVRIRGAAGVFLPHQAKRIAELAERYGSGVVHVTTRQDLQIHSVAIENTPAILESLLDVALSTRGGGGNTVRNISACPNSGVCSDELFDVTPYATALTEYLLRDRANFNLPRKFKVAFSGCSKGCALSAVADLGFFAKVKGGVPGFSVYAGGGMGAVSGLGVLMDDFIPAESIFETTEAVKRMFDKYGDRSDRHKARLRFVLQRVGLEEFRRLFRKELSAVREQALSFPPLKSQFQDSIDRQPDRQAEAPDPERTAWRNTHVLSRGQSGTVVVRIPLKLGDISHLSLESVAELAADVDAVIRTTQDQNLILAGVAEWHLDLVYRTLKDADASLVGPASPFVSCAGASTCKLGLCLSRNLVEAAEQEVAGLSIPDDLTIRVSGCPNSCGQHPIGQIGLYGGARRVGDKLVPYYYVLAGGRLEEGSAKLAEQVAAIPARAIPSLLRDFLKEAAEQRTNEETTDDLIARWGAARLRQLAGNYEDVPSYESNADYYRDFGSNTDFSLAGRGPGECGAGVMDVIALDVTSAKDHLRRGELDKASASAARALLITFGLELQNKDEVYQAFLERLVEPGWVSKDAVNIVDAARRFEFGDNKALFGLEDDLARLIARIEELLHSMDSNLSFRVDKYADTDGAAIAAISAAEDLDLRGVACPMNFVRAKLHLEQLDTGAELDILLDGGEPVRNVPASFSDQGEEVVSVTEESAHWRVRIKKLS